MQAHCVAVWFACVMMHASSWQAHCAAITGVTTMIILHIFGMRIALLTYDVQKWVMTLEFNMSGKYCQAILSSMRIALLQ